MPVYIEKKVMVTSTDQPTNRQGEYRAICLFRKLENRKKGRYLQLSLLTTWSQEILAHLKRTEMNINWIESPQIEWSSCCSLSHNLDNCDSGTLSCLLIWDFKLPLSSFSGNGGRICDLLFGAFDVGDTLNGNICRWWWWCTFVSSLCRSAGSSNGNFLSVK